MNEWINEYIEVSFKGDLYIFIKNWTKEFLTMHQYLLMLNMILFCRN